MVVSDTAVYVRGMRADMRTCLVKALRRGAQWSHAHPTSRLVPYHSATYDLEVGANAYMSRFLSDHLAITYARTAPSTDPHFLYILGLLPHFAYAEAS